MQLPHAENPMLCVNDSLTLTKIRATLTLLKTNKPIRSFQISCFSQKQNNVFRVMELQI